MYKIEVSNNQIIDGENGTVTENAICSYTLKNNKAYIRYRADDNGSEVLTTIISDNESVTIKRSGAISSVMQFKRNSKTSFLYRMPFGSIPMEIDTKFLMTAFDKNNGTIIIRYTLLAQGEKYENNISIKITEGDTNEI